MTLSEELSWRGFVNQTTLENITDLDKSAVSFYWGVDPSSDSMQIGNLAAAMMVRHFIDYGHKAYLLVGGATGMIGDPDGKADERNLKTFDVDLNTSLRLKKLLDPSRLLVTESGISTPADIAMMQEHNIHAFLVGESFMKQPRPDLAFTALFGTPQTI